MFLHYAVFGAVIWKKKEKRKGEKTMKTIYQTLFYILKLIINRKRKRLHIKIGAMLLKIYDFTIC